jgi:hypothetical protein
MGSGQPAQESLSCVKYFGFQDQLVPGRLDAETDVTLLCSRVRTN